jgi:hypothetical protein
MPKIAKREAKAAEKKEAPPVPPAAPPAPPPEEKKAEEPPKKAKGKFDDEYETYLRSEPVHRAYASGQACSNCGAPIVMEWDACPMCGGTKAAPSGKKPFDFKKALAQYGPKETPPETTKAEEA